MRVWAGIDAAALVALRDGGTLAGELVAAESEDEQHEYEALLAASEDGPVVVVAELPQPEAGVTLDLVEAWYVDADGSGELAWYAPEEVGAVLDLLGA